MPLAGSSDTATPILMKACSAVTTARPAPASWQKGSRAPAERSSSRTVRQAEQRGDDAAEHQAEFLARHREDVIGMGVGDAVFDGARAGTDARQNRHGQRPSAPARPDSRYRTVAEILRHAVMHMREDHIGGEAQHGRRRPPAAHPEKRQAGRRTASRPTATAAGRSGRHRAAAAGSAARAAISRKVISGLGTASGCAVGQHRGRQDGEAGLEEFRRLQRRTAEIQFAPRAQHIGADEQHQEGADQGQAKTTAAVILIWRSDSSEAPPMMPSATTANSQLARGIAEIAGGERAAGDGGTGGEGQHQADADQQRPCRSAPPGPP